MKRSSLFAPFAPSASSRAILTLPKGVIGRRRRTGRQFSERIPGIRPRALKKTKRSLGASWLRRTSLLLQFWRWSVPQTDREDRGRGGPNPQTAGGFPGLGGGGVPSSGGVPS